MTAPTDQEPRPERPADPDRASRVPGLRMGAPFGIPIYITPSWFLIAGIVTLYFAPTDSEIPGIGVWRYGVSFAFAVLLYLSVIVHELAHSIVAKRFGLPVRGIVIYFLGGVSEIEREPETPWREFAVSVVGPLLSLVLAGLGYVVWRVDPVNYDSVASQVVKDLLGSLCVANLGVALFNLVPGLPLDGGRVLRAVIWAATKRPMSATLAAAWVGRVVAAVLVVLGLVASNRIHGYGGPYTLFMCVILAAFIWMGAGRAVLVAKNRERLPAVHVRGLTRRAIGVDAHLPLAEALRRANEAGARGLVIVGRQGEPTALVDESAVVATPEQRRPWVDVAAVANTLKPGMVLSVDLGGEQLIEAMRAMPSSEYLVLDHEGKIFGVLAASDVQRAFA